MIVGGYVLHLYCRYNDVEHPWRADGSVPVQRVSSGEFGGYTEADARKQARAAGWAFYEHDVTCPWCSKGRPKT